MNKKNLKNSLRVSMLEVTCRKKIYVGIASVAILLTTLLSSVMATIIYSDSSAVVCSNSACEVPFQVNVQDTLTVAVTTPDAGATGNANEFLRNTVEIAINSNVSNGFTASMYSRYNTNLTHTQLGSVDRRVGNKEQGTDRRGYHPSEVPARPALNYRRCAGTDLCQP